jgi:group I intron endonuclease
MPFIRIEMKGIIYCYHCISTGKKYIGQTSYEEKRKKEHQRKSKHLKNKFYNAVRKYGWESFIYGVIEEYDVEYLNEKEMYYIDLNNTYRDGYNSTMGGDGVRGLIPSEETRKKLSISAKNRTDIHPRKKYFTEEEKIKARREQDKRYRENNKEKYRERRKKWRENNQDKIKKWNEENKEYLKQLWKEKREKNKEYYQKYGKEWREKNKERVKETSKRYYNDVVKPKKKLSQEE